jgi:predicted HTH transcriptional regulator
MANPTLSSSILKSLQSGHMDLQLPAALLNSEKNKARNRTEGIYWDYKEALHLGDKFKIAEFSKDVAAFHNTNGGVIIIGINDDYNARGIPGSSIIDTVQIRDRLPRVEH